MAQTNRAGIHRYLHVSGAELGVSAGAGVVDGPAPALNKSMPIIMIDDSFFICLVVGLTTSKRTRE
ncbi:hypothetical protein ACFLUF_02770 [Chloroflexota bacterium]